MRWFFSSRAMRWALASFSSPHLSSRSTIHCAVFAMAAPTEFIVRVKLSAIGLKAASARFHAQVFSSLPFMPETIFVRAPASRPSTPMTGVFDSTARPELTDSRGLMTAPALPAQVLNPCEMPVSADW